MKDTILKIRLPVNILLGIYFFATGNVTAQNNKQDIKLVLVDSGWANNSVNVTVFRKNSLVTFMDTQFAAFYDLQQYVVLAKRKLGSANWQIKKTAYKGNAADAHNGINLMVDGDGYLHLAWDHHNNALRYCKSIGPGSLELTEKMPMTGKFEDRVTYPEFYRLPNGNLLFLYRNGESGKGNLIINQYNTKAKKWRQVQSNLIDGENHRNAYWQAAVDKKGIIYISWVWRESADVASNHDLCYARSTDGGETWTTSTGNLYQLPITAATAEYICTIPQKTELINQTSMYVDEEGTPFIASYWRDKTDSIPQYHLLFKTNNRWEVQNLGFRKTAFSLSGMGTKRIPVSRPQIVSWKNQNHTCAALIFRDEERGNKVSAALTSDISKNKWQLKDLTTESVGSWEPAYDTELWKKTKQLHLFVEFADQKDSEGKTDIPAQAVKVLEWIPNPLPVKRSKN
jgi:BNR repeat-containing family member